MAAMSPVAPEAPVTLAALAAPGATGPLGGPDEAPPAIGQPPATQAASAHSDTAGISVPTELDGELADLSVPPPLYPVRWPDARRVVYVGQQAGRPVRAELDWQPDAGAGAPYSLRLSLGPGPPPAGAASSFGPPRPVPPQLHQHSRGRLTAHGLAPERLLDRRRGRAARAVNLQWPPPGDGAGQLSFSASTARWPAWPGTQDRLSWLVQLAAVAEAAAQAAAARAGSAPPHPGGPEPPWPWVDLLVADASGGIARWRLVWQGEVDQPLPGGVRRLQHWRHSPAQPDGLLVEAWLDPAQGHWPVGWRYTLLRTGAELVLWQAAPGTP